jgi:hypothetical protein
MKITLKPLDVLDSSLNSVRDDTKAEKKPKTAVSRAAKKQKQETNKAIHK